MAFEERLHRASAGAGVGFATPLSQRRDLRGPALEMRAMAVEFPEVLGQPGRLHLLESRVSVSEEGIQKMKGFVAAFGTVLTVVHLAISYFASKHN